MVSYKGTSLTSCPHCMMFYTLLIRTFFSLSSPVMIPHPSFSVLRLADEENSPLSSPQLPPSLPAAFALPVGNFHTRLIEYKDSLSPIW